MSAPPPGADGRRLGGRVALVTGGARGIGRAICVGLAGAGARVIVDYATRSAEAEKTVELITAAGGEAFAMRADVSDASAVDVLVASAVERYGGLDIVVNNAALTDTHRPWTEVTEERWDRSMAVNLKGCFLTFRAAHPHLAASGHGRVINISSVTFHTGQGDLLDYVSSKGGMIGFTRTLARDVGKDGITVNAITPGAIRTEAELELFPDQDAIAERTAELQAIPRRGLPEDIAHGVVFLAGDEASFITGQTLNIDGGWAMPDGRSDGRSDRDVMVDADRADHALRSDHADQTDPPRPEGAHHARPSRRALHPRGGPRRGGARHAGRSRRPGGEPPVTTVRTVLGDIDADDLGVTYAHEHLVIAGGRPVQLSEDFLLADVDKAVAELAPVQALGLRSVVDAMPADCGRDAGLLAEIARRSGVNVIAPTGLHHERYYHDRHWSVRLAAEQLADLFVADITDGIDAHDYAGPLVERTEHRAGVIKVAGSQDGPSERDRPIFEAAAMAQARTGCPIITHCEAGTGAIEQVELLVRHGATPGHIVLSHVDKVVDRGYQRAILDTGAVVEYDQGFRWRDAPNGTLDALEWAAEDGRLGQVTLGLDAARRGYWTEFGGQPGMTFLLGPFAEQMASRGLDDAARQRIFVAAPAAAFGFATATTTATTSA